MDELDDRDLEPVTAGKQAARKKKKTAALPAAGPVVSSPAGLPAVQSVRPAATQTPAGGDDCPGGVCRKH